MNIQASSSKNLYIFAWFLFRHMEEDGFNQIVYSKNVIEFVTVANEYCKYIENVGNYTTSYALSVAQKILPLVYLKATLVTGVEKILEEDTEKFVSELDYNALLQKWIHNLGEFDSFKEVFKPGMEFSEEALESSISENLIDIYQDLKDFVSLYSLGNEDVMNDGLSECIFQFKEYWGQKLVNVLRAIHMLLVSGTNLDEKQGLLPNKEIKNKQDWVDGFFSQSGEDNI